MYNFVSVNLNFVIRMSIKFEKNIILYKVGTMPVVERLRRNGHILYHSESKNYFLRLILGNITLEACMNTQLGFCNY